MNIYIKFYLFKLEILTGQPAPVWRHLLQGVDVILLDTRYFRSPLLKGEKRIGGPYVPDPDPNPATRDA